MGSIRLEVRDQHLQEHPQEEEIIKAFLPCFFVTWGRLRRGYNTELSVYFLNPEPFMKETFGFDQEIMLVYSRYDRLEPRAVQAAESFMADDPARGRVEKLTYFFISESPDAEQWFHSYTSMNPESKLIIPFAANDLRSNADNAWFVRNKTAKLLYGRDLFDYRLPLESDTYFFGRSELVINLFDAIKRSENRGIFGLRKTGKTSLLYKLERMLKADNVAEVFYYDCKLPSIRKLRWFEFFGRICKELAQRFKLPFSRTLDQISTADEFLEIVSGLTKPVLLIFDEIEYMSPVAIDDPHWHKDFIDFWQTFWACQSRYRKISAMIAGVNPSVVEIDSIGGIQNPLFGIVSYQFLTGLKPEETRNMVKTLGKRIGLKFDHTANDYIHKRYGGHPLLTRMACSVTNNIIKQKDEDRPVTLTMDRLQKEENQRDTELIFYCRHVVSELKQFYPDEYEMLELLASGQVHDFMELAAYPEFTKHLRSYGLLGEDNFKRPIVSIPVIERYIGLELARREGRQTIFRIIPKEDRGQWLEKRKSSVIHDLHLLERIIQQKGGPQLFGPNSFPQADEFICISVVETEKHFKDFIDICNKCFVESIENYGKSIGEKRYYWIQIKGVYPGMWQALHRIKMYRHDNLHLLLTEQASRELLEYLNQDLEGKNLASIKESYFILQQCVLDGLLTGIQIEISNLT